MLTLQVKVGPERSKEYGWTLMEFAFVVNHTGSSNFHQEVMVSFHAHVIGQSQSQDHAELQRHGGHSPALYLDGETRECWCRAH